MMRFFLTTTLFLLLAVLAAPAFAENVLAEIEYFYADDGTLTGKAFNGRRVNFEYDRAHGKLPMRIAVAQHCEGARRSSFHASRIKNIYGKSKNHLTNKYG